ncbi:phospholipase [Dickeya dianthicola]|uniref:Phospholipase n=1 Tax=Dickeya dianthicola TaxID=204039 RepID=A0ABX9NTF7_9GAMM|nr:hypothetical protein [Dickeya dianthicola]MCI4032499.1 phospholipase [Dickeya dianthicola]MCI4113919.1 phospholipase [Dickeya dianthicola]MCI4117721.1 phospholipase [Dickeya dianthicola]MCI4122999.1 phospholipase [Dickeya dianthicola]MCI4172126.1 phospholipase [Dickeya dianthicola]
MEKILIWFCGTGTTKQDFLANVEISGFSAVVAIDGIGTAAMLTKTQALAKRASWGGSFVGMSETLGVLYDQVNGYDDRAGVVTLDSLFPLVDYLKTLKEYQLVVGGHSRGAAVGLTEFLAELYHLAVQNQAAGVWANAKTIRLVVVDPVQGQQDSDKDTNAFNAILKDKTLAQILAELETKWFGGREVFDTLVYSARYDARSSFAFDSRWYRFITEQMGKQAGPAKRAKLVMAGFRHSAPVSKEDEISALYQGKGVAPIAFLQQLVSFDPNWEQSARLLSQIENGYLDQLAAGAKTDLISQLDKQTSLLSYGITGLIGGKSLQKTLSTDNPQKPEYRRFYRYQYGATTF